MEMVVLNIFLNLSILLDDSEMIEKRLYRKCFPGDFMKSSNSRLEVFCKKGFLKNFAKFTGIHFYSAFPLDIAKSLRATFL